MAGFWLRGDFLALRRIRHTGTQGAMRASAVVMCRPAFENRAQMCLGHGNQPIQAFASRCADDPLSDYVRLRTRNGRSQYLDSQGSDRIIEVLGEDPISIVDQVAMPSSISHNFPQLLQRPIG